jgi:hypothetical protein
MGYSTIFKGQLSFKNEPTMPQLAALNEFFGLHYIDLELTKDFTGIKWNDAEKTYDLEKFVNVIMENMRKQWPDFGFTGSMTAQGGDIEDRWSLAIGDDGLAHKLTIATTGKIVTCPHCGERFELEG